ncbi:PAS domain S-box-containing protein [Maribacter sedimenticola]|uniref:histidine kinase n=2 Tax=Maribacter sedimenticola TaxID=228956 RepID=A0ABY1SLF6_9FLAO|nr:PAS domain S-box-containing protein [Maribacter sedimenticola]
MFNVVLVKMVKNSIDEINNDIKSAFFENAHSPFVILDGDMNFVGVNHAGAKTLGINKENFIGKNLLDIFPYLEGTKRYDAYKKVIETGVPIGFDELLFKGANVEFKFMVRAFKIGEYLGVSTLDVTSLVETIAKLKSTQTSLKEVNQNLQRKNQELKDFSYVAAHDLRAPLTNLKSLLEMVLTADPGSTEIYPVVEKMQVVTKVMCDKIRALNQVISIKSNFSEYTEEMVFADVIGKIKLSHSQEIIEGRTIIKEDFSSCPSIEYNPVQLESILQNLMSNALKYRHHNRKLSIRISTKKVNGKTILTFKDNGLGFDQNLADKIFLLFKRMHTHVEGLGIGLYIMNSIVSENGGKIEVSSKKNKGTEFRIQL